MKNIKRKKPFYGPRSLRAHFAKKDNPDRLDRMILSTTDGWYAEKHSAFSREEIDLVNSLRIPDCPFCGSTSFVRNGHRKDGTIRFRCKVCSRQFNPLTGTVFDSRNIPLSEWIEFLIHICQYQSTMVSSIDNENAYSTGKYWIRKIFGVLESYQDAIVMKNVFWTDETYLKVMPKDIKRDESGKRLRGLSRNNICVMTLTDGDNVVLISKGNGKPSSKKIRDALEMHIRPESTMIDDGERSHSVLVEDLQLNRISHPTKETRGLNNKDNPMEPVNRVHRFFKRFMKEHGGYSREETQNWCNLFSFIFNHHGELQKMVKDFLQMAISTRKIVRYRDVFSKKP